MGWPLAVSAELMERSSRALVAALWPLTVGHLLAMSVVILPFALLVALVEWQQPIQIGASLLVIGFGMFRFVNRRHPRMLARIRPTQLGLMVLHRGDRAWRRTDARADLSRALSGRRSRQRPPGGGRAHKRQPWHGRPGFHRPLCRNDRSRRIRGVAGLPLPGSQVRVAELVMTWAFSLILVGALSLLISLARHP
jgi:hypothetical protein